MDESNDVDIELDRFFNDLAGEQTTANRYNLDGDLMQLMRAVHSLGERTDPTSTHDRVGDVVRAEIARLSTIHRKERHMYQHGFLAIDPRRIGANGADSPFVPRQAIPARSSTLRRRRFVFGQFVGALALLITIGLGYLAFNPFSGGPATRSSIPAAIVPAGSPEALATPNDTRYSSFSHVIVGEWAWTSPIDASYIYAYASFNADGTYLAYDPSQGVMLGSWRAAGERVVEVVFYEYHFVHSNVFAPSDTVELPGFAVDESVVVWRLTITIDESGNLLTSEGGFEFFLAGTTTPVYSQSFDGVGRRMAILSAVATG